MAAESIRTTELETKTYSVSKLLDAIKSGRVRIPRFQRGFRWTDEDRRLLFDSLHKGFPVGTLLLASGRAPADEIRLGGYAVDVPEEAEALWVVDGQQRLSTLAMALLEDHSGAYRPLYFDLADQKFVLGSRRGGAKPTWIPSAALNTSATLNRWLRENAVEDELSDRADEIARRIREYQLPAYLVPYDGADDSLLRQIFARVNRRGRTLESHEVFEALHGSVHGAPGPIDRARDELVKLGFGAIDAKHVERAATAVAGADPGRTLDEQVAADDVPALFARVLPGMALAIEFLASDVGVPHVDLLPYGSPLSTLTRFFALHPEPHPRNRELLSRWFWRGTLNEAHRSDYSADRRTWKAIDQDEHASVKRLLEQLPPLVEAQIPSALDRFRRGNARANVEILATAALAPVLLVGEDAGREVPIANLVEDGGFPHQLIVGTDKTLAYFILHPQISVEVLRATPPALGQLATHAIDEAAIRALIAGDDEEFVRRREAALVRQLRAFLQERLAISPIDRDRLPLEAYLLDESA